MMKELFRPVNSGHLYSVTSMGSNNRIISKGGIGVGAREFESNGQNSPASRKFWKRGTAIMGERDGSGQLTITYASYFVVLNGDYSQA